MWQYYRQLFVDAYHATLGFGSSTGYSMVVLSIGATLLSSAATVFVEWWRGGHTMSSFSQTWSNGPPMLFPQSLLFFSGSERLYFLSSGRHTWNIYISKG